MRVSCSAELDGARRREWAEAAQRIGPAAGRSYCRMQRNRLPRFVPSSQFQRAAFEIGKIDNLESRLVCRLEDDGRLIDGCKRFESGQLRTLQVENHVHG